MRDAGQGSAVDVLRASRLNMPSINRGPTGRAEGANQRDRKSSPTANGPHPPQTVLIRRKWSSPAAPKSLARNANLGRRGACRHARPRLVGVSGGCSGASHHRHDDSPGEDACRLGNTMRGLGELETAATCSQSLNRSMDLEESARQDRRREGNRQLLAVCAESERPQRGHPLDGWSSNRRVRGDRHEAWRENG